jgi:alpha-2-macroglobulin
VHPAELYVGLRTPRTFVQKGENITVEAIVTDIEGRLVAGRDFDIRAVLKDWRFDKGSWSEVTVDEQICRITSAGSPQKCTFVAKNGGRYVVTAAVSDDGGRPNESELVICPAEASIKRRCRSSRPKKNTRLAKLQSSW